ncbi:MAG: hypothetical protein JSV29_08150 [Candidatus Bathyarchaeota archaeon]|nr:MAG: hypothetical protein JSV29_08150 [Candidatus Bathyarchaeota archaeon]
MSMWVESKFKGRANYFTPDKDMHISVEKRDELVEYCQQFVKYEDDAYLNGLNVRLYTNMEHVHDFWCDNWWPYSPAVRPHGVVYAIDDGGKINLKDFYNKPLTNPEVNAGGLYNPDTKTAIILNTNYYGQTKPTALGISADILEDQFDILSVHGASAAIRGNGYLLIGPTNAGKTTHSYGPIIDDPKGEFHQDDWIYVSFTNGKAIGHASERRFYMRTNSMENYPWLEPIFRKSKLENVRPDDPTEKFLMSHPRVMIDPKHIVKPEKVVNEVRIRKTFLLKRDFQDNVVARSIDPEEGVEILRKAPEQWYNNYLITYGRRKERKRAELYKKLFEIAEPYQINVIAPVETVRKIIIKIAESG